MRKATVLLLGVLLCAGSVRAQDFRFSVYSPQEIEDKAGELADFLGTVLGAGLVHTAKLHGVPGFDAGVRLVSVFVPSRYADVEAGPLKDKEFVAVPLLHASLGLPGPFEVTVRGIQATFGDKPTRGTVSIFGAGLKVGLVRSLLLPKVSAIVAYHQLTVPESFEIGKTRVLSLRLAASKGLAIVGFYGSLGLDWCNMEVNIPASGNPPYPEGWNQAYDRVGFVGTFGITFSPFPFVVANLDYSAAKFSGFNAGLSISFR